MKHIIHVDNSDFFRKLMKSFLSELGRESESFSRGADAITAVKEGKANCVITGLELADMSSEEFIKRLTVSARIPVIVVTSTEDEAQFKRLQGLGVKTIIRKTDNWQETLRAIM